MSDDETVSRSRPGSGPDLAHRMDRMEQKHEDLAKEVASLSSVVSRVEANQEHARELNTLRFDALDTGLKSLSGQLGDFMRRIEGLISGEVETSATRQGRELVLDYQKWRGEVDGFMDEQKIRNARESGIFATFGAGKTFLLALAAILGPAVAVATLVLR